MMNARLLLPCLIAVAVASGCTPVRSKLPPPYLIDGQSLSAEQMQTYAEDHCVEARQSLTLPPNKFTTDGCSLYRDDGWRSCCIKHDVAYWCGAGPRREADATFRACVRDASSPTNANLMYAGVRLGGGRFMPFPWRFGYGFPWPHRKPAASEITVTQSETSPQTPLTVH